VVVVGVDGSPDSDRAVDWAFAEASRLRCRVHLMYALPVLVDDPAAPAVRPTVSALGHRILADAAARRPDDFEGEVTQTAIAAPAATGLVDESTRASLVVVGSRGHGGFAGLVMGSVSQHVARHARCPVAVVREPADPESDRIVVGVDYSDPASTAMEFAVALASATHASVSAVQAWRQLVVVGADALVAVPQFTPDGGREEQTLLDEWLSNWQAERPDVPVAAEAVEGHPARVLCQASSRAKAVVVGCRGRGAFAGLLLGSTSQEVLHHAHCTVIVVR
jgi:nucleotide-binding universal stress UspA family protein